MDRTEYQINQKLKEGYYPTSIIERVIAFLKKYDYLNDKRYAVRYRDSYAKTKSCKRIRLTIYKFCKKDYSLRKENVVYPCGADASYRVPI